MAKNSLQIKKICIASLMLVLGWILPFITGNIPQFGNLLCPMHLPVLLCGFILGPKYGLLVGVLTPITRSLFFLAPVFYPYALCMAIELGVYGLLSGLMFNFFQKKKITNIIAIYISLIISMIIGRVAWGISMYICAISTNNMFTFKMFITSVIINSWLGIIIQIVIIPLIIISLQKANILKEFN